MEKIGLRRITLGKSRQGRIMILLGVRRTVGGIRDWKGKVIRLRPRMLKPECKSGVCQRGAQYLLMLTLFSQPVPAHSDDVVPDTQKSTRQKAEPDGLVPSFYVRAVTGSLRNRSVCYVCRHGERPVIMVLLYSTHPRLRMLMRNIDRVVDDHRADGLKSFGVYSPARSERPISDIQTFAFNGRIQTPLAIASAGTLPGLLHPPIEDCVATVVLYEGRRIRERFDLGKQDLAIGNLERVVAKIQAFGRSRASTAAKSP